MSEIKTAIATKDAPAAIGPYSQAIRVGNMLFASGQLGIDPATGAIVEGGVAAEAVRMFENVKAVLTAAGAGFGDVVKTTLFLKSMGDFAAVNEVYARYLAADGMVPPARSTIQAALPKDAMVEMECVAVLKG